MGRKYAANYSYFEKLTPESAYWLGFIQADGNVSSGDKNHAVSIEVHGKDRYVLERFIKDISGTYPVKETKGNCVRVRVFSPKMHSDLISYGVLPNKSKLGSFPKIQDPQLFKHYVRGVFDGDGSIMFKNGTRKRPRVVISGGEEFCKDLLTQIQRETGITTGGSYFYSSIYGTTFEGYNSVKIFYDWLYKDAHFFMKRKHDRFAEYLSRENAAS